MKTFLITDTNKALMSGYPQIYAKSGSEAVKKYCKENYPTHIPKASGSNYVQIAVREGYIDENGKAWFYGGKKQTWYELTNN